MAQAKRKRRSKHRGTAAGTIEARGRTGRKPASADKKPAKGRSTPAGARPNRLDNPPTWRSAANRAAIAAVLLVVISILLLKQKPAAALGFGAFALALYIPLGYYMDRALYNRRRRAKATGGGKR